MFSQSEFYAIRCNISEEIKDFDVEFSKTDDGKECLDELKNIVKICLQEENEYLGLCGAMDILLRPHN